MSREEPSLGARSSTTALPADAWRWPDRRWPPGRRAERGNTSGGGLLARRAVRPPSQPAPDPALSGRPKFVWGTGPVTGIRAFVIGCIWCTTRTSHVSGGVGGDLGLLRAEWFLITSICSPSTSGTIGSAPEVLHARHCAYCSVVDDGGSAGHLCAIVFVPMRRSGSGRRLGAVFYYATSVRLGAGAVLASSPGVVALDRGAVLRDLVAPDAGSTRHGQAFRRLRTGISGAAISATYGFWLLLSAPTSRPKWPAGSTSGSAREWTRSSSDVCRPGGDGRAPRSHGATFRRSVAAGGLVRMSARMDGGQCHLWTRESLLWWLPSASWLAV